MAKIRFFIMDENKNYIKKLANYIFIEFSSKFVIETYSSINAILELFSNNEYSKDDIYLIDKKLYFKIKDHIKFKPIIISENPIDDEIDKFISGKKIIEKIYKIYNERDEISNILDIYENTSKLIGFYSPIGGIGVSTLSLLSSIILSDKNIETLFISFETNTSLDMVFKPDKTITLSNYFYYLLSDKELLIEKLRKENLLKYKNVYYINPFESVIDYMEITENEVNSFLSVLKDYTSFKRIIIDIPSSIDRKSLEILNEVDELVIVGGRKIDDYYKMNNFKLEVERLEISNLININTSFLLINKYKEDSNFNEIKFNPFRLAMFKVPFYNNIIVKNNEGFDYNIDDYFKNAMKLFVDKL